MLPCPVMGNPIRDQSPTGRYTVSEAAGVLGISVEAVRGRLKRGTLKSERTEGGTVYVYVAKLGDRTRPAPDQSNDRPTDQALMVARLEDEVEFLRDQLDRERAAHSEARRIIGGLVQRIPEIEAPRESPESAAGETPTRTPEETGGGPENQSSQAEPRPWWRFWR